MSTTGTDNVVIREDVAPIPYPTDSANAAGTQFNQGDMLFMDTSVHYVKPLDTDAHAAYFVGVALDGSYLQVYSDKKYADQVPVGSKGIFRFKTTVGETITDGNPVYIGADAQTVSNVAAAGGGTSYPVGVTRLAPGVTSLTGAAGVFVEVHLNTRFPALNA
jgi:hypothetical protein